MAEFEGLRVQKNVQIKSTVAEEWQGTFHGVCTGEVGKGMIWRYVCCPCSSSCICIDFCHEVDVLGAMFWAGYLYVQGGGVKVPLTRDAATGHTRVP